MEEVFKKKVFKHLYGIDEDETTKDTKHAKNSTEREEFTKESQVELQQQDTGDIDKFVDAGGDGATRKIYTAMPPPAGSETKTEHVPSDDCDSEEEDNFVRKRKRKRKQGKNNVGLTDKASESSKLPQQETSELTTNSSNNFENISKSDVTLSKSQKRKLKRKRRNAKLKGTLKNTGVEFTCDHEQGSN